MGIMDKTVKFFIIGFIMGAIISVVPIDEKFDTIPKQIFAGGITIWKVIYFSILIITLPFLAMEPLKKHFTPYQYLPFPFMAGHGVAFLSAILITMILETFNLI